MAAFSKEINFEVKAHNPNLLIQRRVLTLREREHGQDCTT